MKKLTCLFCVLLFVSTASIKAYAQISVGISINAAPPVLPVYTQPACPVDGYLWTPGYWAYDQDGGYYWVPGVWVSPPQPGYLWTPSYWGYDGNVYVYHEGYWGRHIGFYGGVNYGYGYAGSGYVGGRWAGNSFQYNTAVVNVNTTVVHNTYVNNTVVNNVTVNNNTSFNGPGGITTKPKPQEIAASKEDHVQPTADQVTHRQVAVKDQNQFAKVNNGRPTTTAMNKVNGSRFTSEGHKAANSPNPGNKADANTAKKDNPGNVVKKQNADNSQPERNNNNQHSGNNKPTKANNNAQHAHSVPSNHPVNQQHRSQNKPKPQEHEKHR